MPTRNQELTNFRHGSLGVIEIPNRRI